MNSQVQQLFNNSNPYYIDLSVRQKMTVLLYTEEEVYQKVFKDCFIKKHDSSDLVESHLVFNTVSFNQIITTNLNFNCINIALKTYTQEFIDELAKQIHDRPDLVHTLVIFWCHKPDELLHFRQIRNNTRYDIRDITQITPEWVEWVNYQNLHNHLNRLNTQNVDVMFDQDVWEQNRSLTDINHNLQKAIQQNIQISSRLQDQFNKIERQNIEINHRNEELEKAFKKSSFDHIKLQKALLVNEQQRVKLEQAIEEIKIKNDRLQAQNEEIVTQRDHIQFQTEEIESQRDNAILQRDQIFIQQNEIKDNIQYASRIQFALLPPTHTLFQLLPEHFVLNKPRDVVSGDFYWVSQNRSYTVIAVADCTGHGISGAFMSMLGISFLNEIVTRNNITNSAQILELLRKRVIDSLHQDINNSIEFSRDGMDISICIIDLLENNIEYSGANNPTYIIREDQLIELKPDKIPIGIHEYFQEPFTSQKIAIKPNDQVYMFTDGFADQFGGVKGSKLKYSRFKEQLLQYSNQPMLQQKESLTDFFNEWKNCHEQVDDVLVLGFKIF